MNTAPITPLSGIATSSGTPAVKAAGFEKAFEHARVSFSKHAAERLSRRSLPFDEGRVARLADGIDKAAARGADTSLVLLDELALLVKVPQRLVMTAMNQSAMKDGVVTRIDSAVVV